MYRRIRFCFMPRFSTFVAALQKNPASARQRVLFNRLNRARFIPVFRRTILRVFGYSTRSDAFFFRDNLIAVIYGGEHANLRK